MAQQHAPAEAEQPAPAEAEQPAPEPVVVNDSPAATPAWVRVEDRSTGHQYDVAPSAFDHDLHTKVNKPAQYPDLFGDAARPRPHKHRTDKAGQPVPTENQEH